MKEKFVNYFMRVAEETANLSYAERAKVGCVIVKDRSIISFGYNGTPAGWDNECEYTDYETKLITTDGKSATYNLNSPVRKTKPEVLHAELNAIAKLACSTMSSEGATAFLTLSPCGDCAKLMLQSKIAEIIYKDDYRDRTGIDLLLRGGVKVTKLE